VNVETVVAVKVLHPCVLEVAFADGAVREVDTEPDLWSEMSGPLRDPDVFAQAFVDPELRTVVWPNGADGCPDVLHWGKEGPSWAQEAVRRQETLTTESPAARR
jgi:Protein of unknown function (DUF2442)